MTIRGRAAFTLFEVAISTALVATALISALLVFPVGLRAQQQARFQVYAGVKVLEMMDTFANHDHTFPSHQLEAEELGQAMTSRQWAVDLEQMMASQVMGLLPLPDAIARRIDSDGDRIQRLLDGGGRLFFASPTAYDVGFHPNSNGRNVNPLATERALPPEAQSLVFAVVGDAQQNALPGHPCLNWPYFAYYPSMAATGRSAGNTLWDGGWEYPMWISDGAWIGATPDAIAHFKEMADLCPSWLYTWYPDSSMDPDNPGAFLNRPKREWISNLERIQAYIDHAQKLLMAQGVALTGTAPYLLPEPPPDLCTIQTPWAPDDRRVYPDPAFISGLRYLAAGALARTNWHMVMGDFSPNPPPNGQSDATFGTWSNPPHPLTDADIAYTRDTQELCMRWARRYAATNPYDWGAPRPLNRPSCYDFPLVQFDLFRPYALTKPDLAGDVSWLITAARMPARYARAYTAYTMDGFVPNNRAYLDQSFARRPDGTLDTSGFNLTAPFAAAERCRDIVCWAVDWKAYEDSESAASGPYDASVSYIDSRGGLVDNEMVQYPPDLSLHWADGTRTGLVAAVTGGEAADGDPNNARRMAATYRGAWFGVYGADRDGNGRFDRGPVPSSARMRAVTIGTWHYYDRRLIGALRN